MTIIDTQQKGCEMEWPQPERNRQADELNILLMGARTIECAKLEALVANGSEFDNDGVLLVQRVALLHDANEAQNRIRF